MAKRRRYVDTAGDAARAALVLDGTRSRLVLTATVRLTALVVLGPAVGAVAERADPLIGSTSRNLDVVVPVVIAVLGAILVGTPRGRRLLLATDYRVAQFYRRRSKAAVTFPRASPVGIMLMWAAVLLTANGVGTALKFLRPAADAGDAVFVGWSLLCAAGCLDVARARRRAFNTSEGVVDLRNVLVAYAFAAVISVAMIPVGVHHVRLHNRCADANGARACRADHSLI